MPRLYWRSADVALRAFGPFLLGEKAPPPTKASTVTHYTGNRLPSPLASRLRGVDSPSPANSMAVLRAKNGREFHAASLPSTGHFIKQKQNKKNSTT